MKRTISLLVFLVACGDDRSAPAVPDAPPDPTPDAPPAPVCAGYPLVAPADPGAKQAAVTELAALAPNANLTWNDNTGTLSSVFQLDHTLASCADGEDVNAKIVELLSAHPALFRFDAGEWHVPEPFLCQFVPADLQILDMGRTTLAGHPIGRDTLAYSFKRVGADIVLTSVIGTYLPPEPAGFGAAMAACNDVAAGATEAAIRAMQLPAHTFDNCAPTGDLTYAVKPDDTVELQPGETWTWEEEAGAVKLTATRTVRVTLAKTNVTPELLASDARCPILRDPDQFTVGFEVTIDAHTGEVVFIKPGLDCVVC